MSKTFERITSDQIAEQPGHVYRYRRACDWVVDGDEVIDIACGIGYGAKIISDYRHVTYVGFDKIEPDDEFRPFGYFISGVDLDEIVLAPRYDVAICFETLEHLQNPQHLAEQLMNVARIIIVSVPTQPTKHMNPYHLHDFTVSDIQKMFARCKMVHIEEQPEELSHIFVFEVPYA